VNTAATRDTGNESAAKSIDIGRKINIVSAKLHYDIQIDRECFRTYEKHVNERQIPRMGDIDSGP
jgi:hypothetical protein